MSEYIESVIRTSLNPEGGIYIEECRARWELLQYWRQELSGTNALSEILTITGSPTCAQATSASDYIEGIWGSQAKTLLSVIQKYLAREAWKLVGSPPATIKMSPSFGSRGRPYFTDRIQKE